MSVDLLLTVVGTLALLAVIVAAAFGVADFHVRVVESDSAVERLSTGEPPELGDEVGDDIVRMLKAWRDEATR